MSDEIQKKIRPIYSELQGYLSQIPTIGEHGSAQTRDETLWTQLNSTIDELNSVSENNYDKFKVTGIKRGQMGNFINVSELRTKLGGIIARLHAEHFSNEQAPFSGMPSTTITVSNQQEQNQQQSIVVELEAIINKKLETVEPSNERDFLTELKKGLGNVKDFVSLITLVSGLAEKFGIGVGQLSSLLS